MAQVSRVLASLILTVVLAASSDECDVETDKNETVETVVGKYSERKCVGQRNGQPACSRLYYLRINEQLIRKSSGKILKDETHPKKVGKAVYTECEAGEPWPECKGRRR